MTTKKEVFIVENGFAYTRERIANLKTQESAYYLGYINYDTPE